MRFKALNLAIICIIIAYLTSLSYQSSILKTDSFLQVEAAPAGTTACSPTCQNGGVCNAGVCFCPSYYVGKQCEVDLSNDVRIDKKIAIIICVVSVILGTFCVWLLALVYEKYIIGRVSQPQIRTREVYYEQQDSA